MHFMGTKIDEVFAAACSSVDASLVVSGGKDDKGLLWRIGSAQDFQELTGHGDTVCIVAFSSDGKLLAWVRRPRPQPCSYFLSFLMSQPASLEGDWNRMVLRLGFG